jgi:methyltransferase
MAQPTPAHRMEHVIRTSIQACNDADANAIAACFGPEAVHYSPAGPTWVGAAIIGHHFTTRVREQGHGWTVGQLVIDVDRCAATLEWTRFDRPHARILRGMDWFVFEPQTFRIQEVRPDTAAPIHPDMVRQE